MNTITIIIILVVYILSLIGAWRFIHVSHSKNGRWENQNPDISCLFLTVLPVMNTMFVILGYLFLGGPHDKSINLSSFFKIKK